MVRVSSRPPRGAPSRAPPPDEEEAAHAAAEMQIDAESVQLADVPDAKSLADLLQVCCRCC